MGVIYIGYIVNSLSQGHSPPHLSRWCRGSASDSWSKGRWFDSRLGSYQVNEVNSAFHPFGVGKSSTGLYGWG